jgi:hypothetical protein
MVRKGNGEIVFLLTASERCQVLFAAVVAYLFEAISLQASLGKVRA